MRRNGNRNRWLLVLAALVGTLAGSVVAAAPAAAGVLGLQLVGDVSALSSTDKKVAAVPCPAGKMIISGGASVEGAEGSVHIDRLRPVQHGHYFEAAASEWAAGRTSEPWRLRVYAICAYPMTGVVRVAARSESYDSPLRTAVAECPAGKQLIGFGGAAALELNRRVVLSVVLPSVDLTRVVVQSWQELGGEPADWTAEAYAVCADPTPGLVVVQNSAPPSSVDKAVGVDCGDKQLHAIGSGIFSAGRAGFAGLYPGALPLPAAPLPGGTAITKEDPTGLDWDWHVYTAGICG
jgi:hypothetical protein